MKKLAISNEPNEQFLFSELAQMIEQSQQQAFIAVNSTLTQLFWRVGNRINQEILQYKRAEYGKQIVPIMSAQLVAQYGRNYEEKNLRRMLQFADQFPDFSIVVTVSRQLSWSHLLVLLPLKSQEAKLFYAQSFSETRQGVRELRKQIAEKTFERAALANLQTKSSSLIIPKNTFKDPYLLDFLELQNTYLEADLENAILRELESFMLELGKGFAFVERQKRMIIDGEDFYLDLLFYHRKLRRLVAVELKIDKFHAKYKGQMELYLKWLNHFEQFYLFSTGFGTQY